MFIFYNYKDNIITLTSLCFFVWIWITIWWCFLSPWRTSWACVGNDRALVKNALDSHCSYHTVSSFSLVNTPLLTFGPVSEPWNLFDNLVIFCSWFLESFLSSLLCHSWKPVHPAWYFSAEYGQLFFIFFLIVVVKYT